MRASARQFGPSQPDHGSVQHQDPPLSNLQDTPCHPTNFNLSNLNEDFFYFGPNEEQLQTQHIYFDEFYESNDINSSEVSDNFYQSELSFLSPSSCNTSGYPNIPTQSSQSIDYQLPVELDQFSSPAAHAECYTEQTNNSYSYGHLFSLEVLPSQSLQIQNEKNQTELSTPLLSQNEAETPKHSNKERCKKYRDAKKLKEENLLRELEEEVERHDVLERRAKMLEEKVGKWKEMLLRMARKHNSQDRAVWCKQEIINISNM